LNRQDIYDNDSIIFNYFDRDGVFRGLGWSADPEACAPPDAEAESLAVGL
jgi:hypothetical protein